MRQKIRPHRTTAGFGVLPAVDTHTHTHTHTMMNTITTTTTTETAFPYTPLNRTIVTADDDCWRMMVVDEEHTKENDDPTTTITKAAMRSPLLLSSRASPSPATTPTTTQQQQQHVVVPKRPRRSLLLLPRFSIRRVASFVRQSTDDSSHVPPQIMVVGYGRRRCRAWTNSNSTTTNSGRETYSTTLVFHNWMRMGLWWCLWYGTFRHAATIIPTIILDFPHWKPDHSFVVVCEALSSSSPPPSVPPPPHRPPWPDRTLKVAFVTGNAMKVRKCPVFFRTFVCRQHSPLIYIYILLLLVPTVLRETGDAIYV